MIKLPHAMQIDIHGKRLLFELSEHEAYEPGVLIRIFHDDELLDSAILDTAEHMFVQPMHTLGDV